MTTQTRSPRSVRIALGFSIVSVIGMLIVACVEPPTSATFYEDRPIVSVHYDDGTWHYDTDWDK